MLPRSSKKRAVGLSARPPISGPRGAWDASAKYVQNDLVTYEGSTWRARRDNINTLPISGAVWEQFAAAGEPQADGQAGGGEHQAASQLAPPTGPAGGDLAGNYPNPVIRNLRVTTPKLANNAVTGAKILDGTITTFDIAPNAIGSGRLAPNAVVTSRIADGAVTSAKVLDETLTDLDLAANSVGFAEIQTDAVQATEIADNSIDSGEIVDNSLFSADLGAGSVRGSELGTITRRSATSGIIPGNGTNNVGIQCLAGERVLAGGNDASSAANVVIVASRNDGANGWRVFARNLAAGNQTVTVHAYCLQAS